jgi:hypothetical protein
MVLAGCNQATGSTTASSGIRAALSNKNRLLPLWKQVRKLLKLGNVKLSQPVFKSFPSKGDEEMKCHCRKNC